MMFDSICWRKTFVNNEKLINKYDMVSANILPGSNKTDDRGTRLKKAWRMSEIVSLKPVDVVALTPEPTQWTAYNKCVYNKKTATARH